MKFPESFDFEEYINKYTGQGKIERALFVAKTNKELAQEAYKSAIFQIKDITTDTKRYITACVSLNLFLQSQQGRLFRIDLNWIKDTVKSNNELLDTLESDLSIAKDNSIKEEMRFTYSRMGSHYYRVGDFTNAMKNYTIASNFHSTSDHVAETVLNQNKISIAQGKYPNNPETDLITKYTTKRNVVLGKLSCYSVLSMLQSQENADYEGVARTLVDIRFEYYESYSDIIPSTDIAIYCTMCAAATFNRRQLLDLMNNQNFKNYLELQPEMRELLLSFYNSKYATFFKLGTQYCNLLSLDIYFSPHVRKIMRLQKEKAIMQYIKPYSSIYIQKISNNFNMDLNYMENILFDLIMKRKINHRIDDITKTLHERKQATKATIPESDHFIEEIEKAIKSIKLRSQLHESGLIV